MKKSILFCISRYTKEGLDLIYVNKNSFVIGRSKEADVVCMHRGVSRNHVRVYAKGSEILIEDLGTSNNTRVDDIVLPTNELIKYTPGTKLKLGSCNETYFIDMYRSELSIEEEADDYYQSIKEKALTLRQKSDNEIKSLFSQAREEVEKLYRQVERDTEEELQEKRASARQKAEQEAMGILSVAKAEAQKELNKIEDEKNVLQKKLQQELESDLENKRKSSLEEIKEYQKNKEIEAEELFKQSVAEFHQNANEEKELLLKDSKEERELLLKKSEEERELLLKESEEEAARLISQAESQIKDSQDKMREEVLSELNDKWTSIRAKEQELETHKVALIDQAQEEIVELKRLAAEEIHESHKKQEEREKESTQLNSHKLACLHLEQVEEHKKLQIKLEQKMEQHMKTTASEITLEVEGLLRSRLSGLVALSGSEKESGISSLVQDTKALLLQKLLKEDPRHEKKVEEHFSFNAISIEDVKIWWKRPHVIALGSLAIAFLLWNFKGNFFNSTGPSASELFVQKAQENRQKNKFTPKMTPGFKDTYTKNILYTKEYLETKNNSKYQASWVLEANDFFVTELNLADNAIVKFIALESKLIKKLIYLSQHMDNRSIASGLGSMIEVEDKVTKEMISILEGVGHFEKFKKFRKKFYKKFTST